MFRSHFSTFSRPSAIQTHTVIVHQSPIVIHHYVGSHVFVPVIVPVPHYVGQQGYVEQQGYVPVNQYGSDIGWGLLWVVVLVAAAFWWTHRTPSVKS